jgi:hypothetical protein
LRSSDAVFATPMPARTLPVIEITFGVGFVGLESDGISRGVDLARLPDVELLHDEPPTVTAGTGAFCALKS